MSPPTSQGAVDEATLWPLAVAGDPTARERVVDIAQQVIHAELRSRGARPSDLDDLCQSAVQSVLELVRSGAEVRELRNFLKYRAWGVLSDFRKRRRSSGQAPDQDIDALESGSDPQAGALYRELGRALEHCMQRLEGAELEVVQLRHSDGLSPDQIATKLGLSRNAVYLRWHRALASLRECLSRKGFSRWSAG